MQLDRLLSRIRAALQDYATEFEQRALAAEYTEWCQKAARRLEQVVPLIREGQDYPALQIAEAPPPVLDLVRQLSFADAERWRAFCQKHGLPAAEPFDEQHVELVHQLYGKKIGETHPLYRHYREAMRARREQDALRILQSIRRINVDDANGHAEFNRLAQKLFLQKRAGLEAALAQRDTPRVLALMDAITEDDWGGYEQDPVWQRAAEFRAAHRRELAHARCGELARRLQDLRAADQWEETLPLLAEWDDLNSEFQLALSAEATAAAAAVRQWSSGHLAIRQREGDRQRLWKQLAQRLDELAATPPARLANKALAAELEEWQAQETACAARDAALPPELAGRVAARRAALRRTAGRRRLLRGGLAVAALLALGAAGGAYLLLEARAAHRRQQSAVVEELLAAQNDPQLAAALQAMDAGYPYLSKDPAMVPLLEKARGFLAAQETARQGLLSRLAQLDQAARGDITPAQLAALVRALEELNARAGELGPVSAPPLQATLAERRVQWTQALVRAQEERTRRVAELAAQLGKLLADRLPAPPTAAGVAAILPDSRALLAELAQIPPNPEVETSAERAARAQLAVFAARLETLAEAARLLAAARAQLPQARTLEAYRPPLEALAVNPLLGEPDVAAAHALLASAADWDAAAQRILLPGQAEVWAALANGDPTRLRPAASAQNEDIAFSRLAQNELLANLYRADLVAYDGGLAKSRQAVFLAGKPEEATNRFGPNREHEEVLRSGLVINRDGTTTKRDTRLVRFRDQAARGELLENIQPAAESRLMARLTQAHDARAGGIREALLRVLDDVRAEPEASPLFKAYLQQELLKVMQNRPGEWGLAFAPSAQADAAELARLTGGSLQPTDWMFPANPRLTEELRAFYARTAAQGYYNEATARLAQLLRLRNTPVLFAGYVDAAGALALSSAPPAGATLWGLDSAGDWRPLFAVRDGPPAAVAGSAPARLTPLLYPRDSAGPPP